MKVNNEIRGGKGMRPAWVEIKMKSLRENIRSIKEIIADNSSFMGVIKANGYGHGAVEIATVLREEGVERFAVAIIQEGMKLRDSGFTESILVLGYTPEEDYATLIKYRLTPTIYSLAHAIDLDKAAGEANVKVPVHIKIETGMGRLGFLPKASSLEEIIVISKLSNITIEGAFTHMSSADREDDEKSNQQFNLFMNFIKTLESQGIDITIRHIGNSAVTLRYPNMHLDMVRVGICIYGIYPSPMMSVEPKIRLFQVMEIKARLSHVKKVQCSTGIGYAAEFVTDRESVIGTVPLGYADGISVTMSNRANVLVGGIRCPVVGRICMDQFMVDLSEVPQVETGDEVVIMGRQGENEITADEVAGYAGIISYEVVTRIGERLPRAYSNLK